MDSFGLLTRDKDQKLNKEKLNFIRKIIETSGLSWKEISRKYFISPSTYQESNAYLRMNLSYIQYGK